MQKKTEWGAYAGPGGCDLETWERQEKEMADILRKRKAPKESSLKPVDEELEARHPEPVDALYRAMLEDGIIASTRK